MIRRYKYINLKNDNFVFDNKKIIIWGLSESALASYVFFNSRGIEVIGFTDSFVKKEGDIFVDLPIFTYEQIKEMNTPIIYISTINYEYQKYILNLTDNIPNAIVLCNGEVWGPGEYDIERLTKLEYDEKQEIQEVLKNLYDEESKRVFNNLLKYRVTNDVNLLETICETGHEQYFPQGEILGVEKNEVFVDAGAYNGATSKAFADWTNNTYDKIYMMEPDEFMTKICKEFVNLKRLKNVEIVNCAAYSHSTKLEFKNDCCAKL